MVSRIFYACIGILFALYILRTTMRNKILERESLIWIFFVIIILILGVFPHTLDWTAALLHVAYGPSLLFMIGLIALAVLLLRQTLQSAQYKHKIEELGHKVALLENELSSLTASLQNKDGE